jgi:hypothetical protein
MPSNNWGPYTPATTYEYPADGGVPTAPANPPQSPSGDISGESAAFNFNESETSTEEFLTDVLEVQSPQSGLPAQTSAPTIAGVDPKAIAWNNWTAGTGTTGTKFS